jgi:hypothetical protein
MDDRKLVLQVAADYVSQLGTAAVQHLREWAEAAEAHDDALSARAWHDIGDAAEAQLAGRPWRPLPEGEPAGAPVIANENVSGRCTGTC